MTYIIGWKTKTAVFLSADQAITSGSSQPKLSSEYTSFGETHLIEKNKTIEQRMLKISNILNKIMITFAGDVNTATGVIASFKGLLKFGVGLDFKIEKVKSVLKQAIQSSEPIEKSKEFQLILGVFEDDEPFLISYNDDGGKEIKEHDLIVQIGNIYDKRQGLYPEISEATIRRFINGKAPDEHMLISVNSTLQHYGLHDYLLEVGVGGCFVGCWLNANGVKWQEDTSYLIYDHKFTNPTLVNSAIRDDVLAISSPYRVSKNGPSGKSVFINTVSTKDSEQWKNIWLSKIFKILNACRPFYYVFLSSEERIITIVSSERNEKLKYFQLNIIDESKIDLTITSPLMQKLITQDVLPPGSNKDSAFQFNWM